ncbi:MAG: NAD(P)/FAD-dependent oxidoreductase [Acidimicrobiales bacterium]|nr:NAD(P)/FAD-dependent oxidoreductase [Acidimicrobiales bacterium]MCB9373820.1 NAD(P)/FAD-dependent oxidoreductase [Microthrixaceae bacterium]
MDVAVVGGGVVGCAIARALSQFELDVCLIDRETDVGFGTSKANSGIIHAGHHSASGTLKGTLEWAGNQQWGPLADELGIGFERVGDLTVAFDEDEVATLERLRRQAVEREVPGVELWDGPRLRREEPNLSPEIVAGLFAPSTGVINPYEACFALAEDAVANGVSLLLDAPVHSIDVVPDGLALGLPEGTVQARVVVNAAGLGADRIEAMVGLHTFDLVARKGEEYLLDKRLEGLVRRIVFPCPTPTSKGTLVIPTFDGTIMIGPTAVDVDDRDDLTTTSDGAAQVLRAARRLVPGISPGDCIAEFAGVRAVATTNDFVIGATEVPGFVNVAGIQSPGLTAAPAIAELATRLVAEQGLALSPEPSPVPFERCPVPVRDLDGATRAERASADPAFGRVVCRCELVTEGEVRGAIRRGATTLDGVKFRTRAGMGRCQGGSCTWRVMEALSAETGRPVDALTKRGGDSWLVLRREDPMIDGATS